MKRIVLLVCFIILSTLVMPVLAAPATITLVDVSLTGCSGTIIEGELRVLIYDENGDLINGSSAVATTVHATHSNGPAAPLSWSFIASDAYQFAYSIGSAPVTNITLVITTSNGASSVPVTVGCDGSVTYGGGSDSGMDARLNPSQCDLTTALYATSRGIEVWEIQANSSGLYAGAYTKEDIAAFDDAPPAQNTMITKKLGSTTLEVLTTGEVQIKIAPDAEGKSCTIVLDGILPKRVYFL